MKGIEMMVANLLGMKPEEMREKVEQAVSLMETGAKTAASMQADLKAIKEHLGITDAQPERNLANGGRTAIASNNHIEL